MKYRHARKNRSWETSENRSQMDLSSMVDISFLLLIFFIVTSTIQQKELDLPMTLPVPGGAQKDLTMLPIEVTSDGRILLNQGSDEPELLSGDQEDRQLVKLVSKLSQLKDLGILDTVHVTVRVSDRSHNQRFVDLLNCVHGAGVSAISIQDVLES